MKIFIPEGFIYFYVYGDVNNLFSIFYGSIDITMTSSFLNNINVYDIVNFSENKIRWGYGWKDIYKRHESPFFINLAINDRYNWGYPHTIFKLLWDHNDSIFLVKCSLVKGYINPQSIPFHIITHKKGTHIDNFYDFFFGLVLNTDITRHEVIFSLRDILFKEGLSNDHDHAYRYQLIYFSQFVSSYIVSLKLYNTIFFFLKTMYMHVYIVFYEIVPSIFYVCFLFLLLLLIIFYYFHKFSIKFFNSKLEDLNNKFYDFDTFFLNLSKLILLKKSRIFIWNVLDTIYFFGEINTEYDYNYKLLEDDNYFFKSGYENDDCDSFLKNNSKLVIYSLFCKDIFKI